jgi:type II secretory pathway pseudopilin PulG
MEVLVAVAILAIVVTTILASFNSVFSTTEVLDESADLYAMAKNCMKRIVLDLESIHIVQRPIYKPPELDQPPDPYRIVATTNDIGGMGFAQIRFASRAHVRLEKSPREGIAEIIYYVQSRDDGHLVLKRADNLYPYPDFEERGSDPVLSKYVKSLAFNSVMPLQSSLQFNWNWQTNPPRKPLRPGYFCLYCGRKPSKYVKNGKNNS